MSQLLPSPDTTEPIEGHDVPDPKGASPFAKFLFLQTVFAILLALLLIVGGLMGASTMVKEGNPDINVAIATIQTDWGGADPETIENQVSVSSSYKFRFLSLR